MASIRNKVNDIFPDTNICNVEQYSEVVFGCGIYCWHLLYKYIFKRPTICVELSAITAITANKYGRV